MELLDDPVIDRGGQVEVENAFLNPSDEQSCPTEQPSREICFLGGEDQAGS